MKEDLNKLRDMNKDDANFQANIVKRVEDEDDEFLATNDEVAKKNGWWILLPQSTFEEIERYFILWKPMRNSAISS